MKKLISFIIIIIVIFLGWNYYQSTTKSSGIDAEEFFEIEGLQPISKTVLTHILDTTSSEIIWVGRKLGDDHTGIFSLEDGVLSVGEPAFGRFVIDINSLDIKDLGGASGEKLIQHLKSDDFFAVAKFPKAQFDITNIEPEFSNEVKDYMVFGEFILKGVKRELSFPATIENVDDDHLEIKAEFTMDRTLWGVKYGSGTFFKNLGDNVIKDEVPITLNLMFNRIR